MSSNQKRLTALIKSLSGQANILTIPKVYIAALNNYLEAALLLSQSIYWSDKTENPDGWFYKSYDDWLDEIGLTRFQIKRAADRLKELGLMDTKIKKAHGAPTVHYKVNIDHVTDWIVNFLDIQETSLSGNLTNDIEETSQSDIEETSQSLTETTYIDQTIDLNLDPVAPEPVAETVTFSNLLPDLEGENAGRKASTLKAMTEGIKKHQGIIFEIEKTFSIHPDPGRKDWKALIAYLKDAPADQTVQAFGAWWYANDWRGKQGQPPTAGLIQELWPQAFNGKPPGARPEPKGFAGIRAYLEGIKDGE